MPDSLEKIIELMKSTGDRRVILDSKGKPVYVLMEFADFQNLVNSQKILQKEKTTEKINEDIAVWKESEKENDIWTGFGRGDNSDFDKKSLDKAKKSPEKDDSDQRYYFEPID
jgi:hypothetical protein